MNDEHEGVYRAFDGQTVTIEVSTELNGLYVVTWYRPSGIAVGHLSTIEVVALKRRMSKED